MQSTPARISWLSFSRLSVAGPTVAMIVAAHISSLGE
jgi:hypothetical protein